MRIRLTNDRTCVTHDVIVHSGFNLPLKHHRAAPAAAKLVRVFGNPSSRTPAQSSTRTLIRTRAARLLVIRTPTQKHESKKLSVENTAQHTNERQVECAYTHDSTSTVNVLPMADSRSILNRDVMKDAPSEAKPYFTDQFSGGTSKEFVSKYFQSR